MFAGLATLHAQTQNAPDTGECERDPDPENIPNGINDIADFPCHGEFRIVFLAIILKGEKFNSFQK